MDKKTTRKKFMKKPDSRTFSVTLPIELLEEIDAICNANYWTRTNWFFHAAREKIGMDRKLILQKTLKDMEMLEKGNTKAQ